MKMILMGLGALIVLGGAGAGVYFYFINPAEASVSEEASAKAEKLKAEKDAKKDKGGHGDGHGKGASFVELDPLVLPIVDNDGVSQVVSLVVVIEVPDEAAKKELEAVMPRLKDAFIQEMYGVLSKEAALKGGVLQVSYIKQRLNTISTDVLGAEKFSDVLLQVVQQRPI
jgi:flagellar FliL protein